MPAALDFQSPSVETEVGDLLYNHTVAKDYCACHMDCYYNKTHKTAEYWKNDSIPSGNGPNDKPSQLKSRDKFERYYYDESCKDKWIAVPRWHKGANWRKRINGTDQKDAKGNYIYEGNYVNTMPDGTMNGKTLSKDRMAGASLLGSTCTPEKVLEIDVSTKGRFEILPTTMTFPTSSFETAVKQAQKHNPNDNFSGPFAEMLECYYRDVPSSTPTCAKVSLYCPCCTVYEP